MRRGRTAEAKLCFATQQGGSLIFVFDYLQQHAMFAERLRSILTGLSLIDMRASMFQTEYLASL
jgi:hypothetical protein